MQANVAIITGASRGIGRETALAFAAAGYHTAIVANNQAALEQVKQEIETHYQTQCLVCAGDLSDLSFTLSIAATVREHFGRIDVLVNNAAWRTIETMRTITPETWEKTLRICVTAPAFLAQSCAAVMEEKKTGGCVINLSSMMSQKAGGNSPAYIASKGALESLTKELAVTYGRSGIRVLCVRPGVIDTDMSSDYVSEEGDDISRLMTDELLQLTPICRKGTGQDIAQALVWLSSPDAAYITGCELTIDGGLSANFSSYFIKNLQFPKEY